MTDTDQTPDLTAVRAFDMYLVPTVFGPPSRALVDQAAPKPGERLLDVACGTGAAARHAIGLVDPGGFVAAIDIDPAMIAFGRTRATAGAVDWRVGDAQALPWEDAAFDIVVCHQGYQFFPDRARALAEMHRVLAPGGRLVLGVWCALPYCNGHYAIAKALQSRKVDATAMERPYSFGDPVALGDAIQSAGFREVAVIRRPFESRFNSPEAFVQAVAAGGPSVRHALKQLSEDGLRDLTQDVRRRLGSYIDDWGLRIVMTTNIAVARR